MPKAMIFIHRGPSMRLDLALAASSLALSRREAKRLLGDSRIAVAGRVTGMASRLVKEGERVAVLSGIADISVLELTPDRIVIDKPSGLASQLPREEGPLSVPEVLSAQLRRAKERDEIRVVHRLDTGASGVLVLARNQGEAVRLSRLFAAHEMEKVYLALVAGRVEAEQILDAPIDREGSDRMRTSAEGREAETRIVPGDDATTLLEVRISTGRTHQIRVHLSSAGFPIVGDRKYGGPPAARLMLHAWKLSHPEAGSWSARPPAQLEP